MNALQHAPLQTTLDRLHAASDADMPRILAGLARSKGFKLQPHHMRKAYIAVSRQQGQLLYSLALSAGAKNIVEFGTSFGISTLYLGAAARHHGGKVTTTEIEDNKCQAARQNIQDAGLDDTVTLLEGDALETLQDHSGPIDFLFLDAWSDLYMPLMDLLGPRMRVGATIAVDNANFQGTRGFLRQLEARPEVVISTVKVDKGAMAIGTLAQPWQVRH